LVGTDFTLPLAGRMNVRNAAMATVAAAHFGVSPAQSATVLAGFAGIANRQETMQAGSCTLVLDKATHPVALSALLDGVRQKYPGQRLVSVIRPRATGGRGWLYQRDLPAALAAADLVLLLDPYEHDPEPGRTWPGGTFSAELLAETLRERNVETVPVAGAVELPAALRANLRERDVVVLNLPEQAVDLIAETVDVASRL
jgi:UDP-N-acetylmuramate: L-alanyl-gamma-D-glutamyl-meso-diaminopimelate ligase